VSLDMTGGQKRPVPVLLPVVVISCLATKCRDVTNNIIILKL
jgi:hypothetical protein